MKVAILLGSIRQERKSHRLAYYLKDQLTKKDVTVELLDLKEYPLSVFGSVISDGERQRVEKVSTCIKEAQAVVFVTPEYNSNIPAAVQNIMEYCGRGLIGKVTAIASASASKYGGLHASNNLQTSLLNMGAYPVSRRLLVPEIHFAFNEDNEPVHNEIKEQVGKFLDELLCHADLLSNKVYKS